MRTKKIDSVIATALLLFSLFSISAAAESSNEASACEDIILEHFNAINSGDWLTWANCYTSEVKDAYLNFAANEQNQENNLGILTVNSVDVASVSHVSSSCAPFYRELESYYGSDQFECYIVSMKIEVNEETEYFQSGDTQRLVILVKNNGQWKIGATCAYSTPLERGTSYGFLSGDVDNPPDTITVDQFAGYNSSESITVSGSPKKVAFDTFVTKTVLGEIGNCGYDEEAERAITISDRMFAWWCALGHYRDTFGCDIIGEFDVNYSPSTSITSFPLTTRQNIRKSLHQYAISSTGKFFAVGANNYSKYNKEASGVVVQSGANALAESGYAYEEILHYYLDNSSYNNSDVGIIQIGGSD